MTISNRKIAVVVNALVTLILAGCGEDAGPTEWIPQHGAISGVITSLDVFDPSGLPATPGLSARFPSPRAGSLVSSLSLGRLPRVTPPPQLAATPHDLLITFNHAALGAPPLDMMPRSTAVATQALREAIRGRLAALLPVGATVTGVSPTILAARIHVADAAQRDAIAAALRRDPSIAAVTRNPLFWLDETDRGFRRRARAGAQAETTSNETTPNDRFYPLQSWHFRLIDMPRAWSVTQGSAAVLVAVVDDGIRFDHPGLAANLTSDGYDFVNATDSLALCAGGKISNAADGDGPDPNPTIPGSYSRDILTLGPDTTTTCFVLDTLGAHGVHVTGTIGAVGNDGAGVTGVNWTLRVRPVRVIGAGGFGSAYDVAQGILYAAGLPADNGAGGTVQASTGAKIINVSLGGPDDPTLRSAVLSAANAGALIVAAAGNTGTSIPRYPAGYPEALAVAAVGPDGAPTGYSNFGSYVGIRAPGGNFAFGDATDGVLSTAWDFAENAPVHAFAEGTSMATPHVSGVAALVLARTPSMTPTALRARLTDYATGLASPYGAGLVNAYNSLTERHGPPTERYGRLYATTSGAIAYTVLAGEGGAFEFTQVKDGSYLLYGGTSESGEQGLGHPGSLWGPFGESGVARPFTVLGGQPHRISFSIGIPLQRQGNHTRETAGDLVIEGYRQGAISDTLTLDVYRVKLPESGTYTFETSGWVGACGFALEEATAIGLFNLRGDFLESADFVDPNNLNFCSRLTSTVAAGTYYVAVAGSFGGGLFGGRYRIHARATP